MTFTPIEAVVGGLVIGLTVFWNARIYGCVTGISGAFNSAIAGDSLSFAFVTGLVTGGIVLKHVFKATFASDPLNQVPYELILLSGALVGVGTRLSNGCTSGHGVCGLSRLSRRSFVSVLVFMFTAVETATIFHTSRFYIPPEPSRSLSFASIKPPPVYELILFSALLVAASVLPLFLALISQHLKDEKARVGRESILYLLGITFAGGLIVSGMANPGKTLSFLDLETVNWDPSMVFVFLGALPMAFFGFRPLRLGGQPMLVLHHSLPSRVDIDSRLILGSFFFGIGWGLVGLCPGPALVYFGAFPFSYKASAFALSMACGSVISKAIVTGYEKWVS